MFVEIIIIVSLKCCFYQQALYWQQHLQLLRKDCLSKCPTFSAGAEAAPVRSPTPTSCQKCWTPESESASPKCSWLWTSSTLRGEQPFSSRATALLVFQLSLSSPPLSSRIGCVQSVRGRAILMPPCLPPLSSKTLSSVCGWTISEMVFSSGRCPLFLTVRIEWWLSGKKWIVCCDGTFSHTVSNYSSNANSTRSHVYVITLLFGLCNVPVSTIICSSENDSVSVRAVL